MINEKKKWLTLNSHGKNCLWTFITAISAQDMLTTQLNYLYDKDLASWNNKLTPHPDRERLGSSHHVLTDLGIETAKHYFPKFKKWQP